MGFAITPRINRILQQFEQEGHNVELLLHNSIKMLESKHLLYVLFGHEDTDPIEGNYKKLEDEQTKQRLSKLRAILSEYTR